MESNNELAIAGKNDVSLTALNLFSEDGRKQAESLFSLLMKTDKGGIKSVQEGMAMLVRANDLKLPFSACLEHIHVINGKTGVDIHIIRTLLLRAGVTWNCTKRYAPQYEYTDGNIVYSESQVPEYCVKCKTKKEALDKAKTDEDSVYIYPVSFYSDYNGNVYKEYQLNGNFKVCVNKAQAQAIMAEKKIPIYRVPPIPEDYIYEYEFFREVKGKSMHVTSSFSYKEAMIAGCFDKDTYKKYPKVMISHRAFTYGAREIASDVIMGVMETTELKQINGVPLDNNDLDEVYDAPIID